ncbi:MAG: hypothetical protein KBC98_02870 [Candidatus Pacebacteria bacterium]|nr:hypothetical protein [Candidatus Paceibacterota bacterium]
MKKPSVFLRFFALIALGLVGIIVARNYDAVSEFIRGINLSETFQDDCLEGNCD